MELMLENQLRALILTKDISSTNEVTDPTSRMKLDQVVTGRILKIDYEKFFGT